MLVNHAKVSQQTGTAACAYCHQPAYCARCHAEPVLPAGSGGLSAAALADIGWPLRTGSRNGP